MVDGRLAFGITAITGVLTCLGNIEATVNKHNLLYSGKIENLNVTYEENNKDFWHNEYNKMTITKGYTTYELYDLKKATSALSWDWQCQELEKIVLETKENIREYNIEDTRRELSISEHASTIFSKSNSLYNNLRQRIRAYIQSQRRVEEEKIEQSIPQIGESG